MTNEEALEKIDDTLGTGRISVEAENIAFWETVRSAVEKQILKKPKLKKKDWGHIRYYEVCPICENVVIYNSHNYCDNCGQRLDWSGEV